MASNTLDTILLTDGATRALVDRFLVKRLLKQREFNTPLANGNWALAQNIPTRSGDFARFHRVVHFRRPEKALTDAVDPLSGETLTLERVEAPMEFIHEFVSLGQQARQMSWLDLSNTVMNQLRITQRREINFLLQDMFKVGRYQPFQRDAAGAFTVNPRTTVQATVTLRGNSFTFESAPTYYANRRGAFSDLTTNDRHTMDVYRQVHTRLLNSGAVLIDGKLIAVISDAVKNDLMDDDKFFATAIRDGSMRTKLSKNSLADYGGYHWVMEDEAFTEELGGTKDLFVSGGNVHTSHVFGMDAYGWIRLGGKNSVRPSFKIQDISKTGNELTIGYTVPFQGVILNNEWCANIVGPVTSPGINDGT